MPISVDVGANVAPFKNAMAEAAASAKTLDAALKTNEKQLKATGNQEQYLQQKAQLLSSAMSAQQAIARNAEQALAAMSKGGVSATSVAYQNMQAKMLTAYGTMNDLQAQMNSLDGAAEEAAGSADTLSTSVEGIGKKLSLDQVISGIDRITSVMERAGKAAIDFGRNLWNSMAESADWADDLATNASMYGMSEADLQRRQYASRFIDTSVEAIVKSRDKLANNLKYGSEDAMDVFAMLGISTGTTTGKNGEVTTLRNWEDIFWETGEALLALGDTADSESMSMKVFGKSWDELKPLFRMSEEDFENFGSARERYAAKMAEAPIVSDDDVNKLGALDDAMEELEGQFTVMKETVFASLAPAFTTISDSLSGLLSQFNEYMQTDDGKEMMDSLGESVKALFEGLGDIDFANAIEGVKGGIEGVKDALSWIKDNQGAVEGALAGIVGTWGALKLTGGALEVVNLISGIKGLSVSNEAASAAGSAAGSAWGGGFARAVEGVFKGVPIFAFLMTLLTPSNAGGSLSDLTQDDMARIEQEQMMRNMLSQSEYGATAFGLESYDRLQKLWDLYRDPARDKAAYEAAFHASEFDFKDRPELWHSLMQGMESLPKDLEDLPSEYFKIPVTLDPDTEAAAEQIAATEAHMPVTLDFKLTAGPSTGRIRTPQGWVSPDMPGNANGLAYVPYDGYLTYLHKGERVMTAAANRQYTANSYFNVGVMNMKDGMDADSLAARVADQNRQTMNGFGSR